MSANYMVCNCKQVSYMDIWEVLQKLNKIEDVVSAFEDIQAVTHCSTGCGGCHDKVIRIISDSMYGYETAEPAKCE